MTTPTKTEISGLVSLITDAARTVESYYQSNGENVPSIDNTEPHPLDNIPYPPDVRLAVQTIEGACLQLCASVARPGHTILNRFLSLQHPTSLGVALQSKIADVLLDEPTGMSISEISKRTGMEQRKLERILRSLCSQHVFKEVSKDVFANNRLSIQLLSSNPLSDMGIHLSAEPGPMAASCLAETLMDPETGHSFAAVDSAFNRASGYKEPLFAYFEGKNSEIGAIQGARFAKGVIGWNNVVEMDKITTEFPWAELPQGTVVNDVGGGIGDVIMKLYKQHPNLVFKLQDLPERVHQAQSEVWPSRCPEAIANGSIEFKAFDMIREPPIPNCDIYFLKSVIHCFPDDVSITIFKNIARAMSPTSRLLIHEYIIEGTYRVPDNESAYKQAPLPLLPNFGAGRIRQYHLDIAMMGLVNSEERTLDEYTRLAEAAGLRFVKFWDIGEMGVAEFALAG